MERKLGDVFFWRDLDSFSAGKLRPCERREARDENGFIVVDDSVAYVESRESDEDIEPVDVSAGLAVS